MGGALFKRPFRCTDFPPPHPLLFDMCRQAERQSVELSLWLILIYSNMEALCLHKDIL